MGYFPGHFFYGIFFSFPTIIRWVGHLLTFVRPDPADIDHFLVLFYDIFSDQFWDRIFFFIFLFSIYLLGKLITKILLFPKIFTCWSLSVAVVQITCQYQLFGHILPPFAPFGILRRCQLCKTVPSERGHTIAVFCWQTNWKEILEDGITDTIHN